MFVYKAKTMKIQANKKALQNKRKRIKKIILVFFVQTRYLLYLCSLI